MTHLCRLSATAPHKIFLPSARQIPPLEIIIAIIHRRHFLYAYIISTPMPLFLRRCAIVLAAPGRLISAYFAPMRVSTGAFRHLLEPARVHYAYATIFEAPAVSRQFTNAILGSATFLIAHMGHHGAGRAQSHDHASLPVAPHHGAPFIVDFQMAAPRKRCHFAIITPCAYSMK